MKELQQPTIKTVPAKCDFDFEKYRDELAKHIKKYDVVVTSDNLKEMKKQATELNKLSNAIKAGFKEHIDELKKPADQLTDFSKELQSICQAGRARITEQVAKFEDEALKKAELLLNAFLDECRAEYGVKPDYYSVQVQDHVKLGAVNQDATKLSKAGRDSIESAVKDEHLLQQQTELRLSQLENTSYKSGLDAPITRRHVEPFLFSDSQSWEANLKAVIDAEVERQEVARKKQREQFEREQAEKEEKLKEQVQQPIHQAELQQPFPESTKEPVESEPGRKVVSVWCRFDIEVASHIPDDLVAAKVKAELTRMGKEVAEVRV